MRLVGLFSGIGGLELPFHEAGHETALLCDNWDASQDVLRDRFPDTKVVGDIADVRASHMPAHVDVVTAGFPCTDLSQSRPDCWHPWRGLGPRVPRVPPVG